MHSQHITPQNDGQLEQVTQVLRQDFRCFLNQCENNWFVLFQLAELSYIMEYASTQSGLFYYSYSFHPCFHPSVPLSTMVPAASDLA